MYRTYAPQPIAVTRAYMMRGKTAMGDRQVSNLMKSNTQRASIALFRSIAVALTALVGVGVFYEAGVASPDHIVIIRSAQSVEQIVADELQSTEFARQIATYNGIATIDTMIPAGSTLQIPAPYMETIDFGRIVFVKGDVTLTKTDLVVNPPGKSTKIHRGDVIKTGPDGFVSLSFNSGTTVNLQPLSQVVVDNIDCASLTRDCVIGLNAKKGQVHSEVTPRAADAPQVKFTVDTPFMSAAVRGTAFYVDVESGVNRIGVTRGLVATESAGADFELPRGKGLSASAGVPAAVVDLLSPPEMAESTGPVLLSAEDTFNWRALAGAVTYEAKIATDAKMSEPVVVAQLDELSYQPQLSPGEYHFTVSGIDQQDFVGLAVQREFRFAEIEDSVAPVLDIERHGESVVLKMSDYVGPVQLLIGNSFESDTVQVRDIADMSEPVILDLAQDQDWVFRVRKVLGPLLVSSYSGYYVLNGR